MFLVATPIPAALANTVTVTNCLDPGAGSLRAAVAAAAAGDTIDMTGLTCSSITLTTGEITIAQSSLTLRGPGADKLRIDGNHNSRVLHGGSGTNLYINDLSIVNGYVYFPASNALGGCILSANVDLTDSNVSGCSAQTYSGMAKGGGIYARFITMNRSALTSSSAGCYSGGSAIGGGAVAIYFFIANYSTISNNAVACRPGGTARAGAVYSATRFFINNSTISSNASTGDIGGIHASAVDLRDSTISGNVAAGFIGGMSVIGGTTTTIDNSTIAFNSAGVGSPSSGVYQAPGLHVDGGMLSINSSLIANNTYGPTAKENDLSSTVSITQGTNNLIRVATAPVPNDTISACPLLGPLRNNGGATLTHALLSHSPGIDAGSNSSSDLAYDQRGLPFVRVDHGVADIGAYEVQQEDVVFNSGFDGCP